MYVLLLGHGPGVNILAKAQKFTTYGTVLNFFVSGPILKLFFSAESLVT